jgi:hypothetical protein
MYLLQCNENRILPRQAGGEGGAHRSDQFFKIFTRFPCIVRHRYSLVDTMSINEGAPPRIKTHMAQKSVNWSPWNRVVQELIHRAAYSSGRVDVKEPT